MNPIVLLNEIEFLIIDSLVFDKNTYESIIREEMYIYSIKYKDVSDIIFPSVKKIEASGRGYIVKI